METTMALTHAFNKIRNQYSQHSAEARRNPWFLAWLGLVAVFLLVNIGFIITSVFTMPGLVAEDYYEQGRQYERNALKLMAARNKLQWQAKLEIPATLTSQENGVYRFSAVDARGIPIIDADAQLLAYRPADAAADFTTPLNQIAPGLYQAELSLPLPGLWELHVRVRQNEDVFEMSRRISVSKSVSKSVAKSDS
jgi:nitrogen fixation protein FixH